MTEGGKEGTAQVSSHQVSGKDEMELATKTYVRLTGNPAEGRKGEANGDVLSEGPSVLQDVELPMRSKFRGTARRDNEINTADWTAFWTFRAGGEPR